MPVTKNIYIDQHREIEVSSKHKLLREFMLQKSLEVRILLLDLIIGLIINVKLLQISLKTAV
jgi:hypothetical protein